MIIGFARAFFRWYWCFLDLFSSLPLRCHYYAIRWCFFASYSSPPLIRCWCHWYAAFLLTLISPPLSLMLPYVLPPLPPCFFHFLLRFSFLPPITPRRAACRHMPLFARWFTCWYACLHTLDIMLSLMPRFLRFRWLLFWYERCCCHDFHFADDCISAGRFWYFFFAITTPRCFRFLLCCACFTPLMLPLITPFVDDTTFISTFHCWDAAIFAIACRMPFLLSCHFHWWLPRHWCHVAAFSYAYFAFQRFSYHCFFIWCRHMLAFSRWYLRYAGIDDCFRRSAIAITPLRHYAIAAIDAWYFFFSPIVDDYAEMLITPCRLLPYLRYASILHDAIFSFAELRCCFHLAISQPLRYYAASGDVSMLIADIAISSLFQPFHIRATPPCFSLMLLFRRFRYDVIHRICRCCFRYFAAIDGRQLRHYLRAIDISSPTLSLSCCRHASITMLRLFSPLEMPLLDAGCMLRLIILYARVDIKY